MRCRSSNRSCQIYYRVHDIVDIITFFMIYEIITIHNFAFFVKQRYYVICDEMDTNMSWICWGCTYPRISVCQTSSRAYAVLDSLKRHYGCGNLISRSLPQQHICPSYCINNFMSTRSCTFSMVLSNTALFINLYKLFSKSFLAKVLNFMLLNLVYKFSI